MDSIRLVRELLEFTHTLLEARIDAAPRATFFEARAGSGVVSAAGIYVHTVLGEDHFVSNTRGGPLLYRSGGWDERLGFEPRADITPEWAAGLEFDLEQTRRYAAAVYRQSDVFFAELSPEQAERPVSNWQVIREGGQVRYAKREVSWLFGFMDNVTLHTAEHSGEIAIVSNLGRPS